MKRSNILIIVLGCILIYMALESFTLPQPSDPCDSPVVGDHSGAPGETSCSGCHAGADNVGPGNLLFDFEGGITEYVPGQTYTGIVRLNQDSLNKFGFVASSLDTNNSSKGSFSLIESVRTRIFSSGGRKYVSHTPCGADADTTGTILWKFNWKAPATDVGNITFYLAGLAANHNHTTGGDYTYTISKELTSLSSTGIATGNINKAKIKIYPQPAHDKLTIESDSKLEAITIYNTLGMIVYQSTNINMASENLYALNISVLNSGIYFLHVKTSTRNTSQKIIVE